VTDPRRVIHPARAGLPDASGIPVRPRAVVVGGGIAGLAAATGLAERGVAVDVLEREPHLGGRVGGWTETLQVNGATTSVAMNRGFHAFFRQYYNLRNLLRRIDPELSMLTAVEDYPLIDAHGRRDGFRGLPRTPPLNALAFALRSPTFRLRDLVRINARAAAPLAAVSIPAIYELLDGTDAETFLRDINFPDAARHLAFEVFSRSFFTDPAELSAAELATMFHIYFLGSNEGLVFDVADDDFDTALWAPLRAHLESLGVTFHTGATATCVHPGPVFGVQCSSGARFEAEGVVLATDVSGLRGLVAGSPELGDEDWRSRVERLRTAAPFTVLRLWLDRPVDRGRPAFLGVGGHPPLDNISVVSAYERQAARWAADNGGSVVELHAYAVDDEPEAVRRLLLERLHQLYPETAGARTLGERILHRQDCPRFGPGDFAARPGVATPHPGLALAGDGIRIDLPVALMERAATTGWAAANLLLDHLGIRGHSLYSVPTQGRSPILRRLATSREGLLNS
jgi:carotenoid phi-ring synthase / carotenoid chi-ring synthase